MHRSLAIPAIDDFVFGRAPRPVACGRAVVIGQGRVIPEINFTLPPMSVDDETWPEVRQQYAQMIEGVCQRAVELEVPALLVEFEALPEMTVRPQRGLEITRLLAEVLRRFDHQQGLKSALRVTPNDIRELARPPRMRSGPYWEGMLEFFHHAGDAGADLLAIESTGGKEVSDEALMSADLRAVVFALGVLGARDMEFLWREIVSTCRASGVTASGDTACGFANTAMILADRKMLPAVFAAVVRVVAVARSLVAYEMGAVGPSKDCGYEGPYLKAITGVPISMEGHTAACAHLSSVGNIAQAVCDCWSNESVQNVRLLAAPAPTVSLEQLAYDCRLMNAAAARSLEDVRRLRDWLVDSDAAFDPQAWVLRPDVVLRLAGEMMEETSPYLRARRGARAAVAELRRAFQTGELRIPPRELPWLDRLGEQADSLPSNEQDLYAEFRLASWAAKFLPKEYQLE
jgi:methanol--5-hydroxybenzimidazolylcobamide Co-methyltransferase